MRYTIKSRKLNREITFSRPGKGYVYVDLNGQPGTLGKQICDGGNLMGSTITYSGNDREGFEKLCRRWYRSYVAGCKGVEWAVVAAYDFGEYARGDIVSRHYTYNAASKAAKKSNMLAIEEI